MAIKGAKTIAEYKIREWLNEHEFVMEHFNLSMHGNKGVLMDKNNESMVLVYDPVTKSVHVKEN